MLRCACCILPSLSGSGHTLRCPPHIGLRPARPDSARDCPSQFGIYAKSTGCTNPLAFITLLQTRCSHFVIIYCNTLEWRLLNHQWYIALHRYLRASHFFLLFPQSPGQCRPWSRPAANHDDHQSVSGNWLP